MALGKFTVSQGKREIDLLTFYQDLNFLDLLIVHIYHAVIDKTEKSYFEAKDKGLIFCLNNSYYL